MGVLTEDMKRVVREQRLAFVATVHPDGSPNVSPKGTTAVWDEDHLVFADLASPGTVANLRQNPGVEINVVDPVLRRGYRFRGTATVHTEGEVFEAIRAFYAEEPTAVREEGGSRIRSVVLVRVTEARPVVSPAYAAGLSEAEIRDRWLPHYLRVLGGGRSGAPEPQHRAVAPVAPLRPRGPSEAPVRSVEDPDASGRQPRSNAVAVAVLLALAVGAAGLFFALGRGETGVSPGAVTAVVLTSVVVLVLVARSRRPRRPR